jgi:hypothetical protein
MRKNRYSSKTRKMHKYSNRNRRASSHRSHLARIPLDKLCSGRGDLLLSQEHAACTGYLAYPF